MTDLPRRHAAVSGAATRAVVAMTIASMLWLGSIAMTSLGAGAAAPERTEIGVELFAHGFERPVLAVGSGDGSGDLYVVDQPGRIWRVSPSGVVDPEPWLDLREHVLFENERGLLGLAFHPDYPDDPRFYVTYSRRPDSATVLHEFGSAGVLVEGSGEVDPVPSSELPGRTLLVVPQPFSWHKGGMLEFDAAGMLLMSTGDGGGVGDPFGTAQDPSSLLGKLLRIDVDGGWPYRLPPDNGFADVAGARPEIHALGFRNPWRFSVDRDSGAVIVADVGLFEWEEVNVLAPGTKAASFGWGDMEGPACAEDRDCDPADHVAPAIAYRRDDGLNRCAVLGGYVYRGSRIPSLVGRYLYADYCSQLVWAADVDALLDGSAEPTVIGRLGDDLGLLHAFGQGEDGELYLVASSGHVLRIVAADDA